LSDEVQSVLFDPEPGFGSHILRGLDQRGLERAPDGEIVDGAA
jgi:hypothetical protein